MENCPLNEKYWQLFIENKLSEDERVELKKHLKQDCPCCEEFFAGKDQQKIYNILRGTGHLEVERVITTHEFDSGSQKTLLANVMENIEIIPENSPRAFKLICAAVPTAILSLLVIFVFKFASFEFLGTKGDPTSPPEVILHVAVLQSYSSKNLMRAIPGKYRHENYLFFRYELKGPGYVYFVKTDGKTVDLIHPIGNHDQELQKKGVYEIRTSDTPMGYSLRGLSGDQVFVAMASNRPLDFKVDIQTAAIDYFNGKSQNVTHEWSMDIFEVNVEK